MASTKELELYANLMGEAKVRLECMNAALQGRTGFPIPVVREFCYLQLRMLCEVIALGCLVAHGDLKSLQAHRTGKSYSADDMLERLEKLRPHFYPFACKQVMPRPGVFELTEIPSPLPKDQLLALYAICHKHVHRGTLKKLLIAEPHIDMTINLPEISGWAQRVNGLLRVHTIALDENRVITCLLSNPSNHNKVQVVTAEKSS